MEESTKTSFNSPGFHAHLYLSRRERPNWEFVATKLTVTLAEEVATWKTSRLSARAEHAQRAQQLTFSFDLREPFRQLADRWSLETEHLSNLNKAINHPAYQQIIGMGKVAPSIIIPLILKELQERPDHWFAALHEISGIDPAGPDDNFNDALKAWLEWGKQNYSL